MNRIACSAALMMVFLGQPVLALTPQQEQMKTCNADATKKELKGPERQSFMSQCLAAKPDTPASTLTPQQEKMKKCNADANAQALKGTQRKTFLQSCLSSQPQ